MLNNTERVYKILVTKPNGERRFVSEISTTMNRLALARLTTTRFTAAAVALARPWLEARGYTVQAVYADFAAWEPAVRF